MAEQRAQILRRNMTEAEKRLWSKLRRRQIRGYYFRRQHPVGPYVADFYCAAAALVVEVDGGQHATRTTHDERRTRFLESKGLVVLRFWNVDVMRNMDGVLLRIEQSLLRDVEE